MFSLISIAGSVFGQDEALIIQGTTPNLYIVHKAAAKENYYSVGRMFNVPPKEIAAYNNLAFENGLNLGQLIKIPLGKNNFIQDAAAGNKNLSVPVYHVVDAKEGLYRVSVNYNKVPLEQLKKWNHFSTDAVSSGTKLIVGYLKLQNESPLTKNVTSQQEVAVEPADKKAIEVKKEIPEAKKSEEVKVPDGQNAMAVPKDQQAETNNVLVNHPSVNFNGGVFKKLYDDQQANKTPVAESGLSGVFKSTSGWRDGKYYCFNNNAPAGTILKITNNQNGKSVYAKVLDIIPDITQNAGLVLHISNAAAEELGVTAAKFDCSINYFK